MCRLLAMDSSLEPADQSANMIRSSARALSLDPIYLHKSLGSLPVESVVPRLESAFPAPTRLPRALASLIGRVSFHRSHDGESARFSAGEYLRNRVLRPHTLPIYPKRHLR